MDPRELGFTPKRSVRWLDPRQLADTALRVVLSAAFGAYADKRELEAALAAASFGDRSARTDLWLDYVADVGDGWKPTYTVGRLLALPHLDLDWRGHSYATGRGDILVLGGDQVYPAAKEGEYKDRMLGPYGAALPRSSAPHPALFALPGNHDWYDGLTTFLRVFCQGKWVGGWKTEQTRSYFAVKLPHRWWLWGIDIQLNTYIDEPQLRYFRDVVGPRVERGDGIILCTPIPAWIEATGEKSSAFRNLAYFERTAVPAGARVLLYLSGDLHHYARYEEQGGPRQRITSGGGGAFLYPTHHLPPRVELRERDGHDGTTSYVQGAAYPDARTSRRCRRRIWLLGALNPMFAGLTAALYAGLAGLVVLGAARETSVPALVERLTAPQLATGFFHSPPAMILVALLLRGLVGFADGPRRLPRMARGLAHTVLHLAALCAVMLAASGVTAAMPDAGDRAPGAVLSVVAFLGLTAVGGAIAGSLVMAFYLWVANLAGLHANEAYGAIRLIDHKQFLRLHIEPDGSLLIFPVGIDRVARRFEARPEGGDEEPWFAPRREVEPHLIEEPIRIPSPETLSSPRPRP